MKKVLYIMGELTDSDVVWLLKHGERKSLDQGEVIIQEGIDIDAMYIVLEGELIVKTRSQLVNLGVGEVVGEMSLVDERPPSATVEAATQSTLFVIPKAALQEKLEADVGFAARFYRAIAIFLSGRLRGTASRYGYGDSSLDENVVDDDEMDKRQLDYIYLAGIRFDKILKQLLHP
jgi:CRP-like cAMP-binding protein